MKFFEKLFKGPEVDQAKSSANAKKMRALFNQAVENGDRYRLIWGPLPSDLRLYRGCQPLQLRLCPWQQDQNRQPDRRLERA